MHHERKLNMQTGQVLLLVILVMVVTLTVGLSVVARSISNLRNATEEESSMKALSAAEAGIQQVLKTGPLSGPSAFTNGSIIASASQTDLCSGCNSFMVNNGDILPAAATEVWLVAHNADGSLNYSTPFNGIITIAWGQGSTNCDAVPDQTTAMGIVLLTGANAATATFPDESHSADPCHDAAHHDTNFPPPLGAISINGQTFNFHAQFAVSNGLLIVLKPSKENTPVIVSASATLPKQGTIIASLGTSGNTQRKLEYFQGYPALPDSFTDLLSDQ